MKHKFILRSEEVKENASAFMLLIPTEPIHEVIVREFEENRSLAQNALYWVWVTAIEKEWKWSKEDVHKHFKRKYLVHIYERDNEEYAAMLESVRKVYREGWREDGNRLSAWIIENTSTSDAKVKQFTEYLNDIEHDDEVMRSVQLPHPEDRYNLAMGIKTGSQRTNF